MLAPERHQNSSALTPKSARGASQNPQTANAENGAQTALTQTAQNSTPAQMQTANGANQTAQSPARGANPQMQTAEQNANAKLPGQQRSPQISGQTAQTAPNSGRGANQGAQLRVDNSTPAQTQNAQNIKKSFAQTSALINAYTEKPTTTVEPEEVNQMDNEYNNYNEMSIPQPIIPHNEENAELTEPEMSRKEVRKDYNSRVAKTFLKDIAIVVVAAIILSVVIKSFIMQPFLIPSSSMSETLQIDDKILVNKFSKHFTSIKRGEVIVFRDTNGWTRNHPGTAKKDQKSSTPLDNALKFLGLKSEDDESYLVKRVIGTPGDHVSCKGSGEPIIINGKELPREPYIYKNSNPSDKPFDITVPNDMFFVLGDNRSVSADSRYNTDKPGKGFVPKNDVVGTVFMRIAPMSRFGMLDNNTSVFDSIPNP
jgi:signal peptidase I